MVMTMRMLIAVAVPAALLAGSAAAREDDEITKEHVASKRPHTARKGELHDRGHEHSKTVGIPNVDSLVNFTGQFNADGVDDVGNPRNTWFYSMVGRPPEHGGTTKIRAPIVGVSLDLREADGSPRFVNGQRLFSDVSPFVPLVLGSPTFQKVRYTSSEEPTQFADAVHRAQFFHRADEDWHTLLDPKVVTPRVMQLNKGTYRFALNDDGTCCSVVLVDLDVFVSKLFPATTPVDATTIIGATELAGEMRTRDITTFLFPNTFLFENGDPQQCCFLGFHSYDFAPGDEKNGNLERRFVMNYSSWVSPGLFGGGVEDVTVLSHEVSETYSDPFVVSDGITNLTPWWLAPNGLCQDNLESGDVIEGLPGATFPITLNGFTYHPQNEALLPWFEFKSPSDAIDGAYSYPDTSVVTALSPPQKLNCQ